MLAFASAYRSSTVEDMLDLAREARRGRRFCWTGSPIHTIWGAIIRTAECAGAHGVIRAGAPCCGADSRGGVKASAGAVEYLPVARVTNLTSTIESLKREGIWTYAADMDGEDYADLDLSGPIALVIGAGGEGVSRRVLESCDRTISVPIRGKLDSLNASVAAGGADVRGAARPLMKMKPLLYVDGYNIIGGVAPQAAAGGMAAGRVP